MNRKKTGIFPLILFVCLGYLCFASMDAASSHPNHVARYRDGRAWSITGTVASAPVSQTRRQKFILKNLSLSPVSGESPPINVRGNIQVNLYGTREGPSPGDRIRVKGKIQPIRSFHNPGGFDYTRYMAWQNVWGTVSLSGDKLEIAPPDAVDHFTSGFNLFRSRMAGLIHQASDGDARAVLSALIVGDRRGISASLREAFNRAGVSHVLAISGLHMGIVATAAFVFFRRLLSLFKPLLLRAWVKKTAAVCAVFPVIFYGLLAGMPPSTQRAVIMVSVFLMTFLIEREHDLFNTIAIAALTILIIDPAALFSISFQLSFAAVLSISWGMMNFQPWISQSSAGRNALLNYAATLICVSMCAIVGVSPLVMHYFNTFPVSGFFANLLVVPLMGSLVVIIGLFSVLVLYPFSSQAAVWGLKICRWILEPVIQFIYYVSGQSFAAIKTITPSPLEIICFYLLAWGCVELYRKRRNTTKPPDRKANNIIRRKEADGASGRWMGFMVAAVWIVLFIDISYWANRRLWHDDLKVTLLDVGQGNSAVLEMPGGACVVIDGGGFGDNASFDTGERILAPFLWSQKIRTVDTVVLTHPDADHLNGLVYILKHFHVRQVISTHQAADSPVYRQFADLIRENAINHPGLGQIQRAITVNGATMEILHPDADFVSHHATSSPKDINNNSMVLKVGLGGFSILFPGDILQEAEKELASSAPNALAADILVAPHHGSKTSSSGAFLDAVDPRAIVVSCGKEDFFPSKSVRKRYEERGITVFRTDHNGAVRIVIDAKTMTVEPMAGNKFIVGKKNA
jgi:competence protein ComEC